MKKAGFLTLGAALVVVSSAGYAQQTSAGTSAPEGAPQTSANPTASTDAQAGTAGTTEANGSASAAEFTATEVKQFASAAVAIQELQQDTTLVEADKQSKMTAVIEKSGLDVPRFNQIAQASASDPALMQWVQAAAAQTQNAAEPAAQ